MRKVFDRVEVLHRDLSRLEDTTDARCQDSVASHERKIKQLEDDIASMLRQMKEADRRA